MLVINIQLCGVIQNQSRPSDTRIQLHGGIIQFYRVQVIFYKKMGKKYSKRLSVVTAAKRLNTYAKTNVYFWLINLCVTIKYSILNLEMLDTLCKSNGKNPSSFQSQDDSPNCVLSIWNVLRQTRNSWLNFTTSGKAVHFKSIIIFLTSFNKRKVQRKSEKWVRAQIIYLSCGCSLIFRKGGSVASEGFQISESLDSQCDAHSLTQKVC